MEVVIGKKSKWKEFPLSGTVLEAQAKTEGLLGIETLTNYSILKKGKKRSAVVSVNQNQASKKAKEDENVKKKKKKNNKKKKAKQVKAKVTESKNVEVEETESTPELQVENDSTEDKDDPIEDTQKLDIPTGELMKEMASWSSLFVPDTILMALKELGFEEPTPIQRQVLPSAIKGRLDILGAAETGSGKTLAFGIPMITGILDDIEREQNQSEEDEPSDEEKELFEDDEFEDMSDTEAESGCVKVINNVKFDFDTGEEEMIAPPLEVLEEMDKSSRVKKKLRGLVLTPTRELAIQVKNHLEQVSKYTGLNVAVVVGGMAAQKQTRILSYGPEIVVATPGRLWDLIREGNPHLSTIRDVKYLAIDETDRMVEKGHFEELHQLLEMINASEEKRLKRQTFVFSATLALVHDIPNHVMQKRKMKKKVTSEEKLKQVMAMIGVRPQRKVFDLTRKFGTAEGLTESKIHSALADKDFYLYYFCQMHPGRTLVFCNSIDCVRRLVNLFTILKCSPLGLHAQMHQKQRLKNLERFTADPKGLIIATDVAARGLDIKDVEHVVHYQVPRTSESYIHRSGRTARSFKEGLSVMLIDSSENLAYKKMCKTLNRDKDLPLFPIDHNTFSAIKRRVQVARDLDKLKLHSRKEEVSENWMKKAAEEADLIISDDESDDEELAAKSRKKSGTKMSIQAKQFELDQLLKTPLTTSSFSGKYPTKSGKLEMPVQPSRISSAVKLIEENEMKTKKILSSTRGGSKKPKRNRKNKAN